MTSASSKSNSLSRSFASLLLSSTGFEKKLVKTAGTDNKTRKLAAKYQSEIRNHAKTQKGWSDIVSSIKVSIVNNNSVKVSIEGSNGVKEQAKMLEYGTGEVSPNALLRTFETKFNDDVQISLRGYN